MKALENLTFLYKIGKLTIKDFPEREYHITGGTKSLPFRDNFYPFPYSSFL